MVPLRTPSAGLNVLTKPHRDTKDLKLCVVIPVGGFVRGQLVLVEPGIVVPLRPGDLMISPSCSFTHLNLDYVGR